MSGPEYEAALRRRRIWGVPPDAVEHLIADCRREQTELRARVAELEGQLARATTERDEAIQTVADLQGRIVQLDQENQEIANRPEAIREEAVRFVVDAWTEAQTLREQTRQEIEGAETRAREELAVIRRTSVEERARHEAEMVDERARYAAEIAEKRQRTEAEMAEGRRRYEAEMTEERQRHEADIAALRERRQQTIAELESLAAGLLGQAARSAAPSTLVVGEDAAPIAAESPSATAKQSSVESSASIPVITSTTAQNSGAEEDQLLAKALDDLEVILNASRKSNGG